MAYFEKIYKYIPKKVDPTCPVKLNDATLIKDTVENEMLLRVIMTNQTRINVNAIFLKIYCWDIAGDPILNESTNNIVNYSYQDLNFKSAEMYGNQVSILLPNFTRKFNLVFEKIVLMDGIVWRFDENNSVTIGTQEVLKLPYDFFNTVLKQFENAPGSKYLKYYYIENTDCWQCTCGRANEHILSKCAFCDLSREKVKKELSKSSIEASQVKFNTIVKLKAVIEKEQYRQAKIEEDKLKELMKIKEEEERIKVTEKLEAESIEKERIQKFVAEMNSVKLKAKRKKQNLWILILMSAIGIAFMTFFWLNNSNLKVDKYDEAVSLFEQKKYAEARIIFQELGAIKDSRTKVTEAYYLEGKEALENKKELMAFTLFANIMNYKDVKSLIPEYPLNGIWKIKATSSSGYHYLLFENGKYYELYQKSETPNINAFKKDSETFEFKLEIDKLGKIDYLTNNERMYNFSINSGEQIEINDDPFVQVNN